MMEKFDEFLESVKKIEIEDEEFKKELKEKLFTLYEKRKTLRRRKILLRTLSFATLIFIIIIPTIYILNKIYIVKPSMKNLYVVRDISNLYETQVSKIIENDEIVEEKFENNEFVRIYKSGIKIYEKDGVFVKIVSDEEILKNYNLNLSDLEKIKDKLFELEVLDSETTQKVLEILNKNEKFNFVNNENLIKLKKLNNNLVLNLVKGEKGNWLLLIDIYKNQIIFFSYPE